MRGGGAGEIGTLIHMDEPDHGKYGKLTNDWFKPTSIRRLTDRLDDLSRQAVDKLETLGGEADFYQDVALAYPLQVILSILGLPEADYPRMIKLTQEMFGAEDPDLRREILSPDQTSRSSWTSTGTSPPCPPTPNPIPPPPSPPHSPTP